MEGSREDKAESRPKERVVVGLERLSENLCSILWAIKSFSNSESESEGATAKTCLGDKPGEGQTRHIWWAC